MGGTYYVLITPLNEIQPMKLFLDIYRPLKNLLTLRVTKIRTDSQPSRKTLRQSTQSNCTLTTLILILFLIPLDRRG